MRTPLIAAALLLAGLSSSAQAQEPAATYNANPFKPTNGALPYECIAPAAASTTASFFSGTTPSPYAWGSVAFSDAGEDACPAGALRVSRWEKLTIAGQPAYVMRGGGGTNSAEAFGSTGIRFGHVLASQLAKQTSALTKYIPGRVGAAPQACGGRVYTNQPERGTSADLSRLYYKAKQANRSGAKWDNYGDQAGTGPVHYSYLLWTWPTLPDGARNAGGGQIRAIMESGQEIRACNVSPVLLPMYKAGKTRPSGQAKWYYGQARNGASTVYGWFMTAWRYTNGKWHYVVK